MGPHVLLQEVAALSDRDLETKFTLVRTRLQLSQDLTFFYNACVAALPGKAYVV
jgi:hypothetical protein